VAAHPDDEVLGFGGAMAALATAGTQVHLLSVTDGEASHPRSTRFSPRQLAEIREEELGNALGELGLSALRPRGLRLADTQVHRHEGNVRTGLTELLEQVHATLCVAPWTGDLHSDHEAVGRAAEAACRTAGVPLWLYPVWMWHWALPADLRVPWHQAVRIPLSETAIARKRRALEQFVSQIRPLAGGEENAAILPPDELAHHIRPFEVVFR
jgi:LmbE family N-acetylglucosaminyl deacetylase